MLQKWKKADLVRENVMYCKKKREQSKIIPKYLVLVEGWNKIPEISTLCAQQYVLINQQAVLSVLGFKTLLIIQVFILLIHSKTAIVGMEELV